MLVADLAQIRTAVMRRIIQVSRVVDQQVFSGFQTALARALPMRSQYLFIRHALITKQSIGPFQLGPVRKCSRQSPAARLSQSRADLNQTFSPPRIAEIG